MQNEQQMPFVKHRPLAAGAVAKAGLEPIWNAPSGGQNRLHSHLFY
jgi:hypothetical protein